MALPPAGSCNQGRCGKSAKLHAGSRKKGVVWPVPFFQVLIIPDNAYTISEFPYHTFKILAEIEDQTIAAWNILNSEALY